MKIGFIVECGKDGAEAKAIPALASRIAPSAVLQVVPMDNKPRLKRGCGEAVKRLLNTGCERVLILWDLLPDWGEQSNKGCRHLDKKEICESIRSEGLDPRDARIRLICIEKMLEAWIRADERALSAFLSTAAHPIPVARCKNPESISDPKAALIDLFRKSGSPIRRYVDYEHAIRIVRLLPDLNRLRRAESFRWFEGKLTE